MTSLSSPTPRRWASAGTPRPVRTRRGPFDGLEFTGINAGPEHPFTEAVYFVVDCETQEDVDYYWERLADGGEPGPCGWLKDR